MFRNINKLIGLSLLVALLPLTAAAGPDYDEIAANLVNESLAVRPGEVIQINGTPDQLKLIAAIQVAVSKAGGEPVVTLNLPDANKRAIMESPMEHLSRTPTAPVMFSRMMDGIINVVSVQDPDLFADVPEDRLAAIRKAGVPLNHVFLTSSVRSVSLGQTGGIPTAGYAASIGADEDDMQSMFWQALAVSPQQINEAAALITGMLGPGIDVHIKSKAGTNLRFRVGDFPARVNAGRTLDVQANSGPRQVWLPAGEAYTVLDEGSANGKLVVEHALFRGKAMENLELTFSDGRLTNIEGDNTESLKDFFASADEATSRLSILDVGLNPHSHVLQGSNYRSWEMGGMVTLNIGNNAWAGGDNAGDGAFSVHIPGATVAVGGTRLTTRGQLPKQVLAVFKD